MENSTREPGICAILNVHINQFFWNRNYPTLKFFVDPDGYIWDFTGQIAAQPLVMPLIYHPELVETAP